MRSCIFDCGSLQDSKQNFFEDSGYTVRLYHKSGDAPNVYRVSISGNGMRLELLPSKGLSIYEVLYNERPYFWKPPLEKLKNPDDFDPLGITYLKGTPTAGYRWLELFTGGVEMLGLDNLGSCKERLRDRQNIFAAWYSISNTCKFTRSQTI